MRSRPVRPRGEACARAAAVGRRSRHPAQANRKRRIRSCSCRRAGFLSSEKFERPCSSIAQISPSISSVPLVSLRSGGRHEAELVGPVENAAAVELHLIAGDGGLTAVPSYFISKGQPSPAPWPPGWRAGRDGILAGSSLPLGGLGAGRCRGTADRTISLLTRNTTARLNRRDGIRSRAERRGSVAGYSPARRRIVCPIPHIISCTQPRRPSRLTRIHRMRTGKTSTTLVPAAIPIRSRRTGHSTASENSTGIAGLGYRSDGVRPDQAALAAER